jgi:hypothetical protein
MSSAAAVERSQPQVGKIFDNHAPAQEAPKNFDRLRVSRVTCGPLPNAYRLSVRLRDQFRAQARLTAPLLRRGSFRLFAVVKPWPLMELAGNLPVPLSKILFSSI